MKKLIISLAGGILLSGFAVATSVSAEADYEIQKGDTVSELAKEYGTTSEDLMELNNLSSSLIVAGDQIKIDNKRVLEVKKGDTLSELARDLEIDVNDIKEWNELESDLIVNGQELELELPLNALKNYNQFLEERNGQAPAKKEEPKQNVEQTSNEKAEESKEEQPVEQTSQEEESAQTMTMKATAYTADCEGCSGITATGINLNEDRNKKVIAVDPDVIPLGTKVWVEGYGEAIAGDTGGAIKGDRIDVHVPTTEEANQWGVKTVEVKILD